MGLAAKQAVSGIASMVKKRPQEDFPVEESSI